MLRLDLRSCSPCACSCCGTAPRSQSTRETRCCSHSRTSASGTSRSSTTATYGSRTATAPRVPPDDRRRRGVAAAFLAGRCIHCFQRQLRRQHRRLRGAGCRRQPEAPDLAQCGRSRGRLRSAAVASSSARRATCIPRATCTCSRSTRTAAFPERLPIPRGVDADVSPDGRRSLMRRLPRNRNGRPIAAARVAHRDHEFRDHAAQQDSPAGGPLQRHQPHVDRRQALFRLRPQRRIQPALVRSGDRRSPAADFVQGLSGRQRERRRRHDHLRAGRPSARVRPRDIEYDDAAYRRRFGPARGAPAPREQCRLRAQHLPAPRSGAGRARVSRRDRHGTCEERRRDPQSHAVDRRERPRTGMVAGRRQDRVVLRRVRRLRALCRRSQRQRQAAAHRHRRRLRLLSRSEMVAGRKARLVPRQFVQRVRARPRHRPHAAHRRERVLRPRRRSSRTTGRQTRSGSRTRRTATG